MKTSKITFILFIFSLFFYCKSSKIKEDNNLKSEFITNQVDSLAGYELGTYLKYLKEKNVDFSNYNDNLKTKLTESEFPYDIYVLTEILIEKQENKDFIEIELNSKMQKWDTGNWGNKFWSFIKTNKLNIEKPTFFEFKDGIKIYDFEMFLTTKIKNDELGLNPLMFLNDRLTNYNDGNLNALLKEYEIIQIDYIPKKESVGLFGKRGIDGKISVTTKEKN